jgi:hypothetical protein
MTNASNLQGMHRQIRTQVVQIACVYLALLGLVIWQSHFIWEGIRSNIYLNGIIIGVLLFGSAVVLKTVMNLRNEKIAFAALQEVYTDVGTDRERSAEDPLWRYRRCLEPGVVFSSPKLLGHIYDLTFHELQRTRHMRISLSTMQSLVAAIDQRLAQDRSLLGYLTGLSIFLGLIGTFIGLMEMVGSVGGIIGGLASSDAADVNAIKRLIKDLEAPLVGMAQGFSSSLFGLFGSLVLGLVSRFGNNASSAIRHEFEAWLAGISQIENERNEAGEIEGTAGSGSSQALMLEIAETGRNFGRAVLNIRKLVEQQSEQALVLRDLGDRFEVFANESRQVRQALARTQRIEDAVGEGRREQVEMRLSLEAAVAAGFERLVARLEDRHGETVERLSVLHQHQQAVAEDWRAEAVAQAAGQQQIHSAVRLADLRHEEAIRDLAFGQRELLTSIQTLEQRSASELHALQQTSGQAAARQAEALARLREGQAEAGAKIERLAASTERQADGSAGVAALRDALSEGLLDLSRVMAETSRTMAAGLDRVAEHVLVQAAPRGDADIVAAIRTMGSGLEERFSEGFTDVSRAVEAAFLLNAELLAGTDGQRSRPATPDVSTVRASGT